ncbi:MAG: exonuclease domain-containing protein [Clostridia bacterium]|nr:exonuclease domain-containing protein [Clostridia bacterium]
MVKETYVILDLETTGPSPQDEILEIGAVKLKNGQVIDTFTTLVRPKGKIPLRIKLLTGINDQMVVEAPELNDVLPDLLKFIDRYPLVGHNIAFDYGFLTRALGNELSNRRLDTVDLARIAWPLSVNHRLSTLTAMLKIEHLEHHRALDDARATGFLLERTLETIRGFDLNLLMAINRGTEGSNWPYGDLFKSLEAVRAKVFPSGKIFFDPADNSEVEGLFNQSNDQEEPKRKQSRLDLQQLHEFFGPQGPLVSKFAHYEYREPQVAMVEEVGHAFNQSNLLLMEAGTGTGKSLAYLVPSLLWALGNEQKVVISTHTINLQEQLWTKDIPLLKETMNENFQACLVKGRNNYICLRKWQGLQPADFKGGSPGSGTVFWVRILSWLEQTTTGDRNQLNLSWLEQDWWAMIAGDSENCLGHRCSYCQKNCFIMKARQMADKAHVLIVNHSLLLSDIKTENKVLPPYRYLIIDEAHHLEDEATQHLGYSISLNGILKYFNSLARSQDFGLNPGLLGNWRLRLSKFAEILDEQDFARFEDRLFKALETVRDARESAEILFAALGRRAKMAGQKGEQGGRVVCRIYREEAEKDFWQAIISEKENLVYRIKSLIEYLKDLVRVLEGQRTREHDYSIEIKDLQTHCNGAGELMEVLNFVCHPLDDNYVYWLESDRREESNNVNIKAAPVVVGDILHHRLLKEKETIIFVSATLTVDGNFEYFKERVGLNLVAEERVKSHQVSSPFAYDEQALLCFVKDLPNPAKVSDIEYGEAIAPVIADLVTATNGRTLVLFTSHKMLKDTYFRLAGPLEERGLCLLGHNLDGSRSQLLAEFQERPNSVLFGANSFWEGVDLPGDVLTSVIIVKIPFAVPTVPTVQARLENLRRMEKDSFKHFSIPHAVIRMKQGFGRLIRTRRDQGVIVILDRRVIDKTYGKYFLRSLPVLRHFRGEKEMVVEKVINWLKGEGREQPGR